MTSYDHLVPACLTIIKGLAAKPGIKIVDKQIAADFLAQKLHAMIKDGSIALPQPKSVELVTNNTAAHFEFRGEVYYHADLIDYFAKILTQATKLQDLERWLDKAEVGDSYHIGTQPSGIKRIA